ncbi:MAG: hypothetical protein PUC05_00360 [Firmicutes bacterium]|nr:hypothetical protein [Bacillota bacterium]
MDILLAFILYRQCSEHSPSLPLSRIRPFLPPGTQRGLAAIEAYNGDVCTEPPDKEELFNALECSSIGKFPLLLARMLTMGSIDTSSPEGIFSVLKCLLPPEVLAGMPDPATLMTMINIMSSMDFSDDGSCDEEDCCGDSCDGADNCCGDSCDNADNCCGGNASDECSRCCRAHKGNEEECCDERSDETDDCRTKKEACSFSGKQTSFFKKLIFM